MSRRTQVLVATILGSSVAFVDATVVNVALPTIGKDLSLGLDGRQWVFLSYSLALSALYLPAGAIADRVGLRRTFLGGTIAFAAASALAGAAPGAAFLLAARSAQGVAAAFLTTSSLALLRAAFADESGRAIGHWTAWTGLSTIVGPPAGGALVEWASWRWIFFLTLAPAAVAAILAARAVEPSDNSSQDRERPFDVVGAALLALGLGALTYALVERGPWWLLAPAVAGIAAALVHESRTAEPLLPLGLFRERAFAAANAETLLVYAGLSASTFYVVMYLQTVVGYSPLEASLVLIPISVVMLLLAGTFGRLADRRGPRLFLAVGPALLAAGMLLWELVTSRSSWPALAAGTLVFALGLSITVAPITATALGSAPERFTGVAAALNNAVARIGGLVAVAVVGLAISLVYSGRGTPLTASGHREPTIRAFRAGMTVAAALTAAGALVGAVFVPSRTPRAPRAG